MLDGIDFRSKSSQQYFKCDNTCIMQYIQQVVKYRPKGSKNDKDKKIYVLAFGIITQMFYHSLWPDTHDPRVIARCNWYDYHGINPRNGLHQIKRTVEWDKSCSVALLDKCVALSCTFAPSNPWDPDDKEGYLPQYMDVILHHDKFPKFGHDVPRNEQ